jgi:PKHD-type hydroxylase
MLVKIPALLNPAQLEAVCSVLRQGRFIDGQLSAGKNARIKKNNLELASDDDSFDALNNVVMTELVQNPVYLQTAMPAKICAPIYARYQTGMQYGGHIDDPIMGPPGSRYRSDISISIFLNDPGEYTGGELCIESPAGSTEIKLPAGDAILYPSTSYHSVKKVTAGERLVAITWVQSHIRRADQREILVQLDQTRQSLSSDAAGGANGTACQQLDLCYANLFRMWAEA